MSVRMDEQFVCCLLLLYVQIIKDMVLSYISGTVQDSITLKGKVTGLNV